MPKRPYAPMGPMEDGSASADWGAPGTWDDRRVPELPADGYGFRRSSAAPGKWEWSEATVNRSGLSSGEFGRERAEAMEARTGIPWVHSTKDPAEGGGVRIWPKMTDTIPTTQAYEVTDWDLDDLASVVVGNYGTIIDAARLMGPERAIRALEELYRQEAVFPVAGRGDYMYTFMPRVETELGAEILRRRKMAGRRVTAAGWRRRLGDDYQELKWTSDKWKGGWEPRHDLDDYVDFGYVFSTPWFRRLEANPDYKRMKTTKGIDLRDLFRGAQFVVDETPGSAAEYDPLDGMVTINSQVVDPSSPLKMSDDRLLETILHELVHKADSKAMAYDTYYSKVPYSTGPLVTRRFEEAGEEYEEIDTALEKLLDYLHSKTEMDAYAGTVYGWLYQGVSEDEVLDRLIDQFIDEESQDIPRVRQAIGGWLDELMKLIEKKLPKGMREQRWSTRGEDMRPKLSKREVYAAVARFEENISPEEISRHFGLERQMDWLLDEVNVQREELDRRVDAGEMTQEEWNVATEPLAQKVDELLAAGQHEGIRWVKNPHRTWVDDKPRAASRREADKSHHRAPRPAPRIIRGTPLSAMRWCPKCEWEGDITPHVENQADEWICPRCGDHGLVDMGYEPKREASSDRAAVWFMGGMGDSWKELAERVAEGSQPQDYVELGLSDKARGAGLDDEAVDRLLGEFGDEVGRAVQRVSVEQGYPATMKPFAGRAAFLQPGGGKWEPEWDDVAQAVYDEYINAGADDGIIHEKLITDLVRHFWEELRGGVLTDTEEDGIIDRVMTRLNDTEDQDRRWAEEEAEFREWEKSEGLEPAELSHYNPENQRIEWTKESQRALAYGPDEVPYLDCNGVGLQEGQRVKFALYENSKEINGEGVITSIPAWKGNVQGASGTVMVNNKYVVRLRWDGRAGSYVGDFRDETAFRLDMITRRNEYIEVISGSNFSPESFKGEKVECETCGWEGINEELTWLPDGSMWCPKCESGGINWLGKSESSRREAKRPRRQRRPRQRDVQKTVMDMMSGAELDGAEQAGGYAVTPGAGGSGAPALIQGPPAPSGKYGGSDMNRRIAVQAWGPLLRSCRTGVHTVFEVMISGMGEEAYLQDAELSDKLDGCFDILDGIENAMTGPGTPDHLRVLKAIEVAKDFTLKWGVLVGYAKQVAAQYDKRGNMIEHLTGLERQVGFYAKDLWESLQEIRNPTLAVKGSKAAALESGVRSTVKWLVDRMPDGMSDEKVRREIRSKFSEDTREELAQEAEDYAVECYNGYATREGSAAGKHGGSEMQSEIAVGDSVVMSSQWLHNTGQFFVSDYTQATGIVKEIRNMGSVKMAIVDWDLPGVSPKVLTVNLERADKPSYFASRREAAEAPFYPGAWELDEEFDGWALWTKSGDITGIQMWRPTENWADGSLDKPVLGSGAGFTNRDEAIAFAEDNFGGSHWGSRREADVNMADYYETCQCGCHEHRGEEQPPATTTDDQGVPVCDDCYEGSELPDGYICHNDPDYSPEMVEQAWREATEWDRLEREEYADQWFRENAWTKDEFIHGSRKEAEWWDNDYPRDMYLEDSALEASPKVQAMIAEGLADIKAGRTYTVDELRDRLGIEAEAAVFSPEEWYEDEVDKVECMGCGHQGESADFLNGECPMCGRDKLYRGKPYWLMMEERGTPIPKPEASRGEEPWYEQVSKDEARDIGEQLGVDWETSPFSVEQFRAGIEVELEHADITGYDPIETGEIALAHLGEMPDYYTKLEAMEASVMKKKAGDDMYFKVGQLVEDITRTFMGSSNTFEAGTDAFVVLTEIIGGGIDYGGKERWAAEVWAKAPEGWGGGAEVVDRTFFVKPGESVLNYNPSNPDVPSEVLDMVQGKGEWTGYKIPFQIFDELGWGESGVEASRKEAVVWERDTAVEASAADKAREVARLARLARSGLGDLAAENSVDVGESIQQALEFQKLVAELRESGPVDEYDPDTKVLKLGTMALTEGPVPGLGAVEAMKSEAIDMEDEEGSYIIYFEVAGRFAEGTPREEQLAVQQEALKYAEACEVDYVDFIYAHSDNYQDADRVLSVFARAEDILPAQNVSVSASALVEETDELNEVFGINGGQAGDYNTLGEMFKSAAWEERLVDWAPGDETIQYRESSRVEAVNPRIVEEEADELYDTHKGVGLRSEGPHAGDHFIETGISKVFETPNDEGLVGKWLVNIVYENDTGIVDKESESHKKFITMPIAEFYSMDTDQFVSSYYVDTLLEHPWTSGLDLQGDVPQWEIDGKYMPEIASWLRSVNKRRKMSGKVEAAEEDQPHWYITKDNLNDEWTEQGKRVGKGIGINVEGWQPSKNSEKYPVEFRLLDDDGEAYFEGRMAQETLDGDDPFSPVDDYGVDFGITELQYREGGGSWIGL